MIIDVTEVCGNDIISRDAGKLIRELILKNWEEDEITIVFRGREVASVSFFDEAIALLLKRGNKTKEEIAKKLKFPDIRQEDRNLLNYIFMTRLKEQTSKIK